MAHKQALCAALLGPVLLAALLTAGGTAALAETTPAPAPSASPSPDASEPVTSPTPSGSALEPTPEATSGTQDPGQDPSPSPSTDGGASTGPDSQNPPPPTVPGDTEQTHDGSGSTGDRDPSAPLPNPGAWPIPDVTWEMPEMNMQERIKLREKIALLRARAAKAQQAHDQAQQQATRAKEQARLSAWEATLAEVRAEQAQLVIERYAAGVYRSGSGDASLVRIVNGALDDPTVLLDEQALLSHAAQTKQTEIEQAEAVVNEARELAETAQADLERAQQAETLAEQSAEDLAAELEQAQKDMQLLLSQPLPAQLVIGPDGCPVQVPSGTMRGAAAEIDPQELCARSVRAAATPEAALAIKYAFRALGAPYACEGVGRELPYRYDCSSLVSRAYAEGAGLTTAGDGWAPSTRDMVPWDGVELSPWYGFVAPKDARPGDLILYDTGGSTYRHVVMLLADGMMLHTNSCGDVAKVEQFWGYGTSGASFLVARRVIPHLAR